MGEKALKQPLKRLPLCSDICQERSRLINRHCAGTVSLIDTAEVVFPVSSLRTRTLPFY